MIRAETRVSDPIVAYKRFGDNVPKQIDTDFVRRIDDGVDIALMSLDLSREQCKQWLMEPAEVIQRRNELLAKKLRLGVARDKLSTYYNAQGILMPQRDRTETKLVVNRRYFNLDLNILPFSMFLLPHAWLVYCTPPRLSWLALADWKRGISF